MIIGEKTKLNNFMSEAIGLAKKARGKTAPNPLVGALVVSKDGEIIGRGFHPKVGESHAEVLALNEAKKITSDLSECTLFVTLEPCNHFGRTPPCSDFIIEMGIKNVVVGTFDPNPLMQGQSVKNLRARGLNVSVGICESDCLDLIRGYASVLKTGRPFVTLKAATSLDGKIATSAGESKWITEEATRGLAHELRAKHDAILIGVGTVLADDPQLNVRLCESTIPITKIILDSRLLTPASAKLFDSHDKVFIYCDANYCGERKSVLEKAGATVIPLEENPEDQKTPGFLNLKAILQDLASKGVQDLLIEGGARVLGAIAREELFDHVVYFMAPKILGSTSRDVFEGLDVRMLSESIRLENVSTRLVGSDIVIEGSRVHGTS